MGSPLGGWPGQVNWPGVQGGLPVPPVSRTRPLGNSDPRERQVGALCFRLPFEQWQFPGRTAQLAVVERSRMEGETGGMVCVAPHSRATAYSEDHWHLSWARVLEVSPSS